MDSKRQSSKPQSDALKASDHFNDPDLWSALSASISDSDPNLKPRQEAGKSAARKAIHDLLYTEGLLAARLAQDADTLQALQKQLVSQLPQNSMETRTRYAQSLLRWFFPDGLSSLLPRVAAVYRKEAITADVLRCNYLMAEPIVGTCVAKCLFPLDIGLRVPGEYIDRFLTQHLGATPPVNTRKRLKTNLMRLGFLGRSKGRVDQLLPVSPTSTATLLLLHDLFAKDAPRTIELRRLFDHPFWMYLGYKSPDAVRQVLRAADVAGLVGKYVVADQLEQVTTCYSLDELLDRRARL